MKKRLVWLASLFLVILVIYLSRPIWLEAMGRFLIVRDALESAQIIVVLGGDNNGERVKQGVDLFWQGYSDKLIMSGGSLAWNLTSAQWMKKQALAAGVPASAILLEDKSESTLENAQFTLPILKKQKVKTLILVTSPYHSRRAKRVFNKFCKKEGIKIISCPAQESDFRLADWWTRHEDTQPVIWEYVSLVYYFFKGL